MQSKFTVLILDDENVLAEMLKKSITELNDGHTFAVITCSDGLSALEIIKDPVKKVDVLITDLVHPEISGIKLIRTVRENFPQIKIIVQTGFGDKEILDLCNIYADQVLQKPFKITDLTKAIRHLFPAGK